MDGRHSRNHHWRRRIARSLVTLVGLYATSSVLPAHVVAQLPSGRYVRDVAAGDDLEHVISESLPKVKGTLAKIFKGKAKSRLRQVIVAAAWQRFTPIGDAIRLETDAWSGDRAITVRPGETVQEWHRYWPNGKVEKLDVLTTRQANTLTYKYVAEDGRRTDTYELDATGNVLTQSVKLESNQLSSPIHYRLVYHRERGEP